MPSENQTIEGVIVEKAKELGASLAGITTIAALKTSPSFETYAKKPLYDQYDPESPDYHVFDGYAGHEGYRSVLVWALSHPIAEPALDWWSIKVKGYTPGNRIMQSQASRMRDWLEESHGIKARSLHYQVERGGTFLKDAAHLAGLGVIGKNNLLVTPEFGTRVRLRGMFIETELEPTGPLGDFDPCNGCDMPCHRVCPKDAFRSGSFDRSICRQENDERNANEEWIEGTIVGIDEPCMVVKPCRYCELACPVAQSGRRMRENR